MVNSRQLGRITVKKGIDILEQNEWVCDDTEKVGRFIKNKDLFSKLYDEFGFDAIAIKPGRTKLIQFKTNHLRAYTPYIKFSETYPQFEVEVWCWYKKKIRFGKGFRIVKYINGIKSVIDLRVDPKSQL